MASEPTGEQDTPAAPERPPADDAPAPEKQPTGIGTLAAVIAALTFVVFASVADNEFVDFDDFALILWNPDIRVSSLSEAVASAFTTPQMSGYVPLTTLSHQIDFLVHGESPTGPHLENVVLHLAATLLIFLALARMTGARGPSAFVAAIFAIHPLHVESVAWASERKDVLSGVFFGAMLLAYSRYTERPQSMLRYVLVVLLLMLGLLSKPTLVAVPFALLLLDYWPLQRLDREAVREKLPMFGLAAIASFAAVMVQSGYGALSYGQGISAARRIANVIQSYFAYIVDSFWPSNLAAFYPYPQGELPLAQIAAQAAILVAVTAIAFWLRGSRPYLITGWLWFLGMLVPVIGLVQVGMQARADRYMYLPLLGLAIAVVFGIAGASRDRAQQRIAAIAGAAAVLAFAFVASNQVATWQNSFTVYERAVEVSPDAAFPVFRLGMVHAMTGDMEEARSHLERAYSLNPRAGEDAVRQLNSMAAAHAAMDRFGDASKTTVLAIQVARSTEQQDRLPELRRRLSDYQARRIPDPEPDS